MKNIPVRNIITTQKEPDLSGRFNIRAIHDLLGGKDLVQELHRHDFFYMLVLKKGKGQHAVDFTEYEVGDHAIFLMRPGQVHQHVLKVGSTGYLVAFKPEFYAHDIASRQPLRKASSKSYYRFEANTFKKLLTILDYIFQEFKDKQEGYAEVINANLGIFFIELVRHISKDAVNNAGTYMQERLEAFLELLEADVARQKQVSYYTDVLNLSPYQLNAITKTTLNKTCSELINEYIILESKRYLLATSNQVNQIAYQLGYDDVSYFIRFFKKHTGYSPDAFRQNFR